MEQINVIINKIIRDRLTAISFLYKQYIKTKKPSPISINPEGVILLNEIQN